MPEIPGDGLKLLAFLEKHGSVQMHYPENPMDEPIVIMNGGDQEKVGSPSDKSFRDAITKQMNELGWRGSMYDPNQAEDDSRRLAILYVSHRQAILLLSLCLPGSVSTIISLPAHEPLPADAELVDVCYAWERRAFALRIRSKEFAVVQDGCVIPELNIQTLMRAVLISPFEPKS